MADVGSGGKLELSPRLLSLLNPKKAKDAIATGLTEGLGDVEADVKADVPVDEGHLKQAVGSLVDPQKLVGSVGTGPTVRRPSVIYASVQDLGAVITGHPWLWFYWKRKGRWVRTHSVFVPPTRFFSDNADEASVRRRVSAAIEKSLERAFG